MSDLDEGLEPIKFPIDGKTDVHVAKYGKLVNIFYDFDDWIEEECKGFKPIFVSDNPAFDWQWINYHFHKHLGRNPFGWSARRIGDYYAGLTNNWRNASKWKKLRITKHRLWPCHNRDP